ncbi:ABC transporter ATP-binding protein/permease [Patescibacteria group bacterium]|nr:ABC transporter ATP-binding protein/permease [Patescibacteria group bacterium]MBU1910811.1 ABC transporter ATP-binding protein/permease [Patescibacteria group bacterium]
MPENIVIERPPNNPFIFAWFVSKEHRPWAVGALISVVLAEVFDSTLAVLLKSLIDAITAASASGFTDNSAMWLWAIVYPAVYFIDENTWRCSGFCGMRWITYARAQVHRKLFAYLTEHSSSYFNDHFAGSLTNKISNASWGTGDILSAFIWEFLPLGVSFILSFIIAFVSDWRLGAILGIWVAIFLTINVFLVLKKKQHAFAVAKHGSVLKGKMVDAASNMAAVQQGGHHEYEREYVEEFIENYRTADLKNWWLSEWILFMNGTLIAMFIAGMLWTSLYLLTLGLITIGSVVMIIMIILRIVHSLFFIGQKMTNFIDNYSRVQEGLDELIVPHEIVDEPDAKPLAVPNGAVAFNSVNFSYEHREVFKGLELTIPAGQKVGLVGTSGAGKTTLANLLLRQFELQDGSIFIDNQDICKVTRETLRKGIAMVPQDVSLFHRSIRDNIRYGDLDASDEAVEKAAQLAQAHGFISELPDNYSTFVGERGVKLSGGQRQRIAIARAILKNAKILVLDEATSSLDSESEAAIQRALLELIKDKTVLAIAHRLSTLQAMDRIVVIEDGIIHEDGTHDDLLDHGGVYAKLWESQVRGFIQ